jgi:thiamine-monophosphate kinase
VALDALPLPAALPREQAESYALSGGDEYELCFTAPPENAHLVSILGQQLGVRVSRIGQVTAGAPTISYLRQGRAIALDAAGFDHFSAKAG